MAIILILGGLLFLILIIGSLVKKVEDNEVQSKGGLRMMYNDYFTYLKESFPNLKVDTSHGALISYTMMIPESRVQFEFKSRYIKCIIFTKYNIYISNSGSLKLLHTSEKYRFENSWIYQFEMFEGISTRVISSNEYWSHVANHRYPNRD